MLQVCCMKTQSILLGATSLTLLLCQCTTQRRVVDRQRIEIGGKTIIQERVVISEKPLETEIIARVMN